MAKKSKTGRKTIATLKHDTDKRKNIPTAEFQSVLPVEKQEPIRIAYERRNRDLDPQLGLRGKVQCIYLDPPYGIKFNSNFQWSTTSRDVKDGKTDHITREPEQVKAFRDTWRDGIHSYLTYLRDRLTVARDLLTDSGSIFVQISDENVHLVRALMDEVLGDENFLSLIAFAKTSAFTPKAISNIGDHILWYAR